MPYAFVLKYQKVLIFLRFLNLVVFIWRKLLYTGIENVSVEHETYSPGMVKSVMSGSNYIRGNVLLSETLQRLQIYALMDAKL